jgi:hypothetical protein
VRRPGGIDGQEPRDRPEFAAVHAAPLPLPQAPIEFWSDYLGPTPPGPQAAGSTAVEVDRPQDLVMPDAVAMPVSTVRSIAGPGRPFSFN